MELWPHQRRAIDDVSALMNRGCKRILVTSPTGGGKTVIMEKLLEWGFSSVLYTNRIALREQTGQRLAAAGFEFGVRAAGVKPRLLEKVQLSSIQTERARVYQKKKWELHDASLVLVDEAHLQAADTALQVMQDHVETGATIVGMTATPIGLGHAYDELVVAGTTSELRECGALVPAVTYAPDEPDPQGLKETADGGLTEPSVRKAMPPRHLFGRVIDNWRRLNPDQKPTILFAPGVKESLYFAEQFQAQGVDAAHIDGENVWIRGQWYDPSPEVRTMLRKEAETGGVKVVCNRFVLREGIDWPFLYHGIFATAFSSLSSYLQSGGRLLRAHPSLDHVIVQDHGGNWHRHGSLNSDREWNLEHSHRVITGVRAQRLREKSEPEPIVCPRCSAVRLWGRQCERCGHESRTRSRQVLQSDGTLKEMKGDIYKPRRRFNKPGFVQQWRSMYYRAKNAGMTFAQAEAVFAKEHDWIWPPRTLPLMPLRETDWFLRVADVPYDQLTDEKRTAQRAAPVDDLEDVFA